VHATEACGRVEEQAPGSFNLGIKWRWAVSYIFCPLHIQSEQPVVPTEWEAVWDPEPAWKLCRRDKSLAYAGKRTTIPRTSSPHPSHYTDWAIPALTHVRTDEQV